VINKKKYDHSGLNGMTI